MELQPAWKTRSRSLDGGGGEGMKNRDEEIDAERSKPLVGKGQIAQCQVQKGREKSEARSSKGRDQDRITNMRL